MLHSAYVLAWSSSSLRFIHFYIHTRIQEEYIYRNLAKSETGSASALMCVRNDSPSACSARLFRTTCRYYTRIRLMFSLELCVEKKKSSKKNGRAQKYMRECARKKTHYFEPSAFAMCFSASKNNFYSGTIPFDLFSYRLRSRVCAHFLYTYISMMHFPINVKGIEYIRVCAVGGWCRCTGAKYRISFACNFILIVKRPRTHNVMTL